MHEIILRSSCFDESLVNFRIRWALVLDVEGLYIRQNAMKAMAGNLDFYRLNLPKKRSLINEVLLWIPVRITMIELETTFIKSRIGRDSNLSQNDKCTHPISI